MTPFITARAVLAARRESITARPFPSVFTFRAVEVTPTAPNHALHRNSRLRFGFVCFSCHRVFGSVGYSIPRLWVSLSLCRLLFRSVRSASMPAMNAALSRFSRYCRHVSRGASVAGFEALFPSADSSHRSRAFAASFRMSTLGGTTMPVQQTEGVRGLDVFGVFIGQILSAPSLTGALICLWCWFHAPGINHTQTYTVNTCYTRNTFIPRM